jgi:hypothetical protein
MHELLCFSYDSIGNEMRLKIARLLTVFIFANSDAVSLGTNGRYATVWQWIAPDGTRFRSLVVLSSLR